MKQLIALTLVSLLGCAAASADETVRHSTVMIPIELVVDAVTEAQKHSSIKVKQERFVMAYQRGVLDGLLLGEMLYSEEFKCGPDANPYIDLSDQCGYLVGINSYLDGKIKVTLSDFGYREVETEGVYLPAHAFPSLLTVKGEWSLSNPKGLAIKPGIKYRFKGLLGPDLGYTGPLIKRQFIVHEVKLPY